METKGPPKGGFSFCGQVGYDVLREGFYKPYSDIMEMPDFLKRELPEREGDRAYGFSSEERRRYYGEYLSESLGRDFSSERRLEIGRRRDLLLSCADILDSGDGLFRKRLIDEATGFADCVVSSKVRPEKVFGDLERWAGEQKACHQNVQEIVREIADRVEAVPDVPETVKAAVRELASEEHIFFNSFALFVAYAEVVGFDDDR